MEPGAANQMQEEIRVWKKRSTDLCQRIYANGYMCHALVAHDSSHSYHALSVHALMHSSCMHSLCMLSCHALIAHALIAHAGPIYTQSLYAIAQHSCSCTYAHVRPHALVRLNTHRSCTKLMLSFKKARKGRSRVYVTRPIHSLYTHHRQKQSVTHSLQRSSNSDRYCTAHYTLCTVPMWVITGTAHCTLHPMRCTNMRPHVPFSYCYRAVLMLYSCCPHAVLMLYSCCTHAVLMLYLYCTGCAAGGGTRGERNCGGEWHSWGRYCTLHTIPYALY
jgi:hypothetical protein